MVLSVKIATLILIIKFVPLVKVKHFVMCAYKISMSIVIIYVIVLLVAMVAIVVMDYVMNAQKDIQEILYRKCATSVNLDIIRYLMIQKYVINVFNTVKVVIIVRHVMYVKQVI